ncbi:MAG: trigger factor [Alphaproteobacteria bacterium]
MQVTQTRADGLKREFTIVVAAEDIQARVEDRLQSLQKSVRIRGFRPGKVPVSLLKKRYGKSLLEEVVQEALDQTSARAMAEQGLRPAIRPKIEVNRLGEGADLEYTMAVEVMPDIAPGDFTEIELTRYVAKVADDEVEKTLRRLADQEKRFAATDKGHKAEKGDAVVIDYTGAFEGRELQGGKGENHSVELGSGAFLPELEERLVGAKAGDRVDVTLTLPDDYVDRTVAGKDAAFDVRVKEVHRREPVVIDDAFAQRHGAADLAGLRPLVREGLENRYAAVSRSRLKRALLDKLAESYDFEVPQGMVDLEFEAIWDQVEKELQARGEKDDKKTKEELHSEYRAIAERRVRLGLLLTEVGRLNNIEVDQDELNRAIFERARMFPGHEQQVADYYRRNPEALNELRAPLFEDKVAAFILALAKVTEKTITAEELMREPDHESGAAAAGAGKGKGKKPAKRGSSKKAVRKGGGR